MGLTLELRISGDGLWILERMFSRYRPESHQIIVFMLRQAVADKEPTSRLYLNR